MVHDALNSKTSLALEDAKRKIHERAVVSCADVVSVKQVVKQTA